MKSKPANTVVKNLLHHRIPAKPYRGFFTSVSTLEEELPPDCSGKLADGSCSNSTQTRLRSLSRFALKDFPVVPADEIPVRQRF